MSYMMINLSESRRILEVADSSTQVYLEPGGAKNKGVGQQKQFFSNQSFLKSLASLRKTCIVSQKIIHTYISIFFSIKRFQSISMYAVQCISMISESHKRCHTMHSIIISLTHVNHISMHFITSQSHNHISNTCHFSPRLLL